MDFARHALEDEPLAGTFCTSAALRRSLFLSPSAGLVGSRSSTRADRGPMAVPTSRPSTLCWLLNAALIGLCLMLGAATALRQEQLALVARTALAGLAAYDLVPYDWDGADLPAMDPSIARVVDPRPALAWLEGRGRGAGVEPFQYDLQPGESLADVAGRFGVSVAALLWNNGLQSAEQVRAGQRLIILPMNGVLHRVQPGETARQIAERYGIGLAELVRANGLEDSNGLLIGRALVVPGGIVPLATTAAVGASVVDGVPGVATPQPTAPSELSHEARVEAAMARPDPSLPMPPNAGPSQREFIRSIVGGARESQRATGVPTSVTLAQAILESDWGRNRLAREAKNLFGIKAHSRPGTAGVYNISTWEVVGGANIMTPDAFKAYLSYADSIVDHGRWFHQQPRYAGALAVRDDPRAFARAISAAGYATDPAYAAKLIGLMDRYNLYAYDLD